MNLLERLNKGPIICAEGYLFAMERSYLLGAFVPEVVIEHPSSNSVTPRIYSCR